MAEFFHAVGVQPIEGGAWLVCGNIAGDRRHQFLERFVGCKAIDPIGARDRGTFDPPNQGEKPLLERPGLIGLLMKRACFPGNPTADEERGRPGNRPQWL